MYKRYWGVFITYICFIFSALYVFAPILINGFGIPKENAFLYVKLIGSILTTIIIFGTLYTKTNFFIASLVSLIAFAVPHMDFKHLLSYIATGFVLSFFM